MSQVIQIIDGSEYGLNVRSILGLNIFSVNSVNTTPPIDPRVELLRVLSDQQTSAAFISGQAMSYYWNKENQERFRHEMLGGDFTDVNVYGGIFYSLKEYPNDPTLYFPRVTEELWRFTFYPDELAVMPIIDHDGLALCVSGEHEVNSDEISVFKDETSWMQSLAELFKLVVMTNTDGYNVAVYYRDPDNLKLLDAPIEAAVRMVTSSEWYQDHASELVWDEANGCFQMPRRR